MNIPGKVVIEIDCDRYQTKVLGRDGNVLWQDSHKMESSGRASQESGCDIYESGLDESFGDLCESIQDLSFGPFGIACALYAINEAEEKS